MIVSLVKAVEALAFELTAYALGTVETLVSAFASVGFV
jgi:hypothetical protein